MNVEKLKDQYGFAFVISNRIIAVLIWRYSIVFWEKHDEHYY